MVIKNKNGTPYNLRGPNPIMKEQDIWDDFLLHNMNFPENVITNNNKEINQNKPKLNLGKVSVQNADDNSKQIIPAEKEIEPPVEPKQEPIIIKTNEEEVEKPTVVNAKLLNFKKTVIHCLPASTEEKIDDLYGEKTLKINYGNKFNFEAIMIREEDLSLQFWTHLEKISKYSILYPKNKEKRWWKVIEIKKAPEGFFIHCMPSEYHPNFDQ